MGRRKGDPLLQAAMGFPGRRKKSVEKEIEVAAEAAAKELAPVAGTFPVPRAFTEAPVYWGEAIRVWREKADNLKIAGRRRPAYMSGLVRYCMWYQLFVTSAAQLRRDLPRGGTTVKVKKGDGEWVFRTHPSIEFMSRAETALRLLEAEYGFTPYSDTSLVRVETFNAAQGRFPFGGDNPAEGEGGSNDDNDPMNLMTEADSPPPGQRPN